MIFKTFKYKVLEWFKYLFGYIRNVFFKLILLFIVTFVIFGLYFDDFFKNNFVIFLILLGIDLYLVSSLLHKKAKLTKILVTSILIVVAFVVAQDFADSAFDSFGLTSFINDFNNNTVLSDKVIFDTGKGVIKDTTSSVTHSKEDSQITFEYINKLRQENGVKTILWDDKIYDLAKYKVEDMGKRKYFDHVDPDGKCVGNYAKTFGLIYPSDSFADNIFGYSSSTWFLQNEAVDTWMGSRGHRYNLLYSEHIRGAIACDNKNCVFIGQGGEGWVCATGKEGLAFWDSASKQSGEA